MNLNLGDLDYISTESPNEIDIPNLTFRETNYLNQILNIPDKEQELIDKAIVSQEDIKKYKRIYKYMPNFYDVRL